jgi:hypothetical protein
MPEDMSKRRSWLSERWFKIVKSGDDKHRLAGTRWENVRQQDGLKHYVTKYASKTYQKQVPETFQNVGRFWGVSRSIQVMPVLLLPADSLTVREHLERWPYAEVLEHAIPRVLFNASEWWAASA